MEFRKINPEETYSIRHRVLRPHQALDDCKYPADFETNSFHLGAFLNHQLIGVASFYQEVNPALNGEIQYRLRGMATLPDYRSKKAGSGLLFEGIEMIRKRKSDTFWCNARTTVSDFYKSLGMDEMGEVFDINPIGPHKLMYMYL